MGEDTEVGLFEILVQFISCSDNPTERHTVRARCGRDP